MEELETPEPGGQMSFLEHLDELRKRIVYSVVFVVIVFFGCWFVSDYISGFLSVPIRRARPEAARRDLPVKGLTGEENLTPLTNVQEGMSGRYTFDRSTKIGATVLPSGASVLAKVARDPEGKLGLFTTEDLITTDAIVPAGVRLINFDEPSMGAEDERLI